MRGLRPEHLRDAPTTDLTFFGVALNYSVSLRANYGDSVTIYRKLIST